VLTGTPDQIVKLFKSTENGLFSRFLFYSFEGEENWISVAPKETRINYQQHFSCVAEEVNAIHEYFSSDNYEFKLTKEQWAELDNQFSVWLKELTTFFHKDAKSTIIRLGLVQFRIAMILSILRHVEAKSKGNVIVCSDSDFKNAQLLAKLLLEHGLTVFSRLPRESKLPTNVDMARFHQALPADIEFQRKEALEIGLRLGFSVRTVDKYLKELLKKEYLVQSKYSVYKKV
jgi:hypothetical protein